MSNFKEDILSLLNNKEYRVLIRNAGKFKFHSNYKFEKHRHSEIEINYINTGCCVMEIGDMYVPLKEGDCIVIHPYISHSFMVDMSKTCSITQLEYSVTIPSEFVEKIPAFHQKNEYQRLSSCNNLCKSLENVCRSFREQKEEDEYSGVQLELALAQMYVVLSSQIAQKEKADSSLMHGVVGEVIQYINNHIEEELNLEELAEKYHVSDRYIRKYFNKYLGMNCTKYISMLRISKAKELLWNSNKSITEIAMLTGFNSSQYFSRVFHKYMNMTPAAYREMWRGIKAEV